MEPGGKNPVFASVAGVASAAIKSISPFASEYAKQITSAEVGRPGPFYGHGVIQGQPGTTEASVQCVRSHIGVPYIWGDMNPVKGLDCSSLIQTAAREVRVKPPRVTCDQQHANEGVDGIENIRPDGLTIYHKSGYVVIYISDNQVTHAPRSDENMTEVSVKNMEPIDTTRCVMHSENDPVSTITVEPTAATTRRLAPTTVLVPLEANMGFNPSRGSAPTLANRLSGQNQVSGAYGRIR